MNGEFVDLTSSSPHGQRLSSNPYGTDNAHASVSSNMPQDRKRRRLNDGSLSGPSTSSFHSEPLTRAHYPPYEYQTTPLNDVEAVDMTGTSSSPEFLKAVSKQQEDAVKAQQPEMEPSRSILAAYKCPVCMDTLEDATTTTCGHLFCHKCIVDTLRFSEEQRGYEHSKRARGSCPVCRTPLSRVDTPGPRRNLVPLQLKLTTKSRQ